MTSSAIFSPCGKFRYQLKRTWADGPRLLICMLNPSTADAEKNDPTITRCIHRAKSAGYGGLIVVNLYAYRSPYPADLQKRWQLGNTVIGPGNDQAIEEASAKCDAALIAWGNHPLAARRDFRVIDLLGSQVVLCLGLTNDKFPRHPLHVAYKVPMQLYGGRMPKYDGPRF